MSPCGHGQSQVWSACRCVCQQENPTLKRDDRCVAARAACRVCEVILQQKASTHTQRKHTVLRVWQLAVCCERVL